MGDSKRNLCEHLIINLFGTRGNPYEGVRIVERGNGCNHLSAFASTPFITGPDVVLVVDAAVVFTQFPPKSLGVGGIFDMSKGNESELYIQIRQS